MRIDLKTSFEQKPLALDFIWHGFLSGTVGALVSPGGVGKSYWALLAAMAIACRVKGGDLLEIKPHKTGKVVYIAGEDPCSVIAQRIHSIGGHFTDQAKEEITKNLVIESMMGERLDIMSEAGIKRVLSLADKPRLIILDTLSRIHQLDENSNRDMALLITRLEQLAVISGASVLFLHHVSKTSGRDANTDQRSSRGASALIDNSRWCGYLTPMTPEESSRWFEKDSVTPIGVNSAQKYLRFGENKRNFASAKEGAQWYQRSEEGVLVCVTLHPASGQVGHRKPAPRSKKAANA